MGRKEMIATWDKKRCKWPVVAQMGFRGLFPWGENRVLQTRDVFGTGTQAERNAFRVPVPVPAERRNENFVKTRGTPERKILKDPRNGGTPERISKNGAGTHFVLRNAFRNIPGTREMSQEQRQSTTKKIGNYIVVEAISL